MGRGRSRSAAVERARELLADYEPTLAEGYARGMRAKLGLREEHSVYMLGSSRINVAGGNARNLDYLAGAVANVL